MTEIDYIESGIYQDSKTPEKIMIIIEVSNQWIYTYDFCFQTDTCISNQFINNELKENMERTVLVDFKRYIPGVLPFFTGGYLGTIKNELFNVLKNDLKVSQNLGII